MSSFLALQSVIGASYPSNRPPFIMALASYHNRRMMNNCHCNHILPCDFIAITEKTEMTIQGHDVSTACAASTNDSFAWCNIPPMLTFFSDTRNRHRPSVADHATQAPQMRHAGQPEHHSLGVIRDRMWRPSAGSTGLTPDNSGCAGALEGFWKDALSGQDVSVPMGASWSLSSSPRTPRGRFREQDDRSSHVMTR